MLDSIARTPDDRFKVKTIESLLKEYKSSDVERLKEFYSNRGSLLDFLMLLVKARKPEILEAAERVGSLEKAAKLSLKQLKLDISYLEHDYNDMQRILDSLPLASSQKEGEDFFDRELSAAELDECLRKRLAAFIEKAAPVLGQADSSGLLARVTKVEASVMALLARYPLRSASSTEEEEHKVEDHQILFESAFGLFHSLKKVSDDFERYKHDVKMRELRRNTLRKLFKGTASTSSASALEASPTKEMLNSLSFDETLFVFADDDKGVLVDMQTSERLEQAEESRVNEDSKDDSKIAEEGEDEGGKDEDEGEDEEEGEEGRELRTDLTAHLPSASELVESYRKSLKRMKSLRDA